MNRILLLCSSWIIGMQVYAGGIPTPALLADSCAPVSTLPCADIRVNLPVNLTFDEAVANTISDKNGMGTGFTMVSPYSGNRPTEDGAPTVGNVPGYEPSKLTLSAGKLQLVTNKGINYLTSNNQLNALGVKVNSGGQLQVGTTLINPFSGTQAQQAGIWFGLDDKTFLKLIVFGKRIELRREINDASSNIQGNTNPDQRITAAINGLNNQTVRLRLVVDPEANVAEGFYSTNGSTYISTGASYPTPALSIAGMGVTDSTAYTGIFASHRSGSGSQTYTFEDFKVGNPERPYVIASMPPDGATGVSVNTVSIAANNLFVPEVPGFPGGVDNTTITDTTVKLLKVVNDSTEVPLAGVVQGTGGGDAISFSPAHRLDAETMYKFVVTDGVKSHSGAAFLPYEATFTTGETPVDTGGALAVVFEKIPVPGTQNKKYTSLTFGPDGKFYALRLNGAIERFTVNHSDGSLTGQQVINTLINAHGTRSAIGLVFDPRSTATNLIAWVSHSSGGLSSAPAFDGNISRLSGPDLENEELVITRLPRSTRDHMVNSMTFGPDGALYIAQGGNTSMGAYDATWQRNEELLSAAILRLDMQKLEGVTLPLNVQTTSNQGVINNAPSVSMHMSDGTYNPYGSKAPLTIYASGIRNAYDMVWHTNGQLYIPTNGSAAGGKTPASVEGTRRPDGTFYDGPAVPATSGVQAQHDWLFRVNPLKGTGYFGHPNPRRGEYVAFRGYTDNPRYPPTVQPDVRYRGAAFDFEPDKSPNGVIEYKSDAFNGLLKGKILVCRFSGGGDIIVLEPGSAVKDPTVNSPESDDRIYDIVWAATGAGMNGIESLSGFVNPLDIAEDVENGNLYLSEYDWNNQSELVSQITLLRVKSPEETKINFQLAESPTPEGYQPDAGLPFDSTRGYGWIHPSDGQPKSQEASMRVRAGTDPLELRTLAHMQASNGGQTPGSWEYAVPNGQYLISVSAGDPDYFDSNHRINVEGVPAINGFVPSAQEKYRSASVSVEVNDGRLTLDATGGTNSKINYVHITPVDAQESDARLAVENMDGFPADDHLVFSRIQIPWRRTNPATPYNANHDKVRLRVNNEGSDTLVISNLSLSAPHNWKIDMLNDVPYDPAAALPVKVHPGAYAEVVVEFTATDAGTRVKRLDDTLYLTSNDGQAPLKKVMLHGLWQLRGEGRNEPFARQIIRAFGFKTQTGFAYSDGADNRGEVIVPESDEIIAPFFVKADASKPVSVLQMAAYHGCCAATETISWYNKGSSGSSNLLRHNPLDGQSLLPRRYGSNTALARGTFNPSGAFGFKVANSYSDRSQNYMGKIGLRVWKAIDDQGNQIPDTYIVGMDYVGTSSNYDYQDNIYYVSNVKPEAEEPPLAHEDEDENENSLLKKLLVYPNPNLNETIHVLLENFAGGEEVRITMLDMSGRTMQTQTVMTNEQGAVDIEMPSNRSFDPGIYLINAIARSGKAQSKLIIP